MTDTTTPADHLLHLRLDSGWHSWAITCTHGTDTFHTFDTEGGGKISDDCWVLSWLDDLRFDDYAIGDWPEQISFPCPVHCAWNGDGLEVSYRGSAGGGGSVMTDTPRWMKVRGTCTLEAGEGELFAPGLADTLVGRETLSGTATIVSAVQLASNKAILLTVETNVAVELVGPGEARG